MPAYAVARPAALLAAAIIACFGVTLSAQEARSSEREETRVTIDVTRVSLLATVTDKKGHFVSSLAEKDFIIEDGNQPQKVLQFRSESDLPLRLAILIDASNSVRTRFQVIQDSAIAFLENTLRPGKDKATLISFDSVIEPISDFTDDVPSLAKAIRELRAGRGTAMYDAIEYACKTKFAATDPHEDSRRIIVIISDGDDTQSRITRSLALEIAHKTNAIIYTVSMGITQPGAMGMKVLVNLAAETGGRALFPFAVKDLTHAFKELAEELRSQYSVVYRPEPLVTDGRFHPIAMRVKDRKDLQVRTRRGYYAPAK